MPSSNTISGAHVVVYSTDPEADRGFFRRVLNFPNVDAGEGWLIFALPPAELGVHPAKKDRASDLYLLCDDLKGTMKFLKAKKIKCSAPSEQSWGIVTTVTLPSGGKMGLYQPKHDLAPHRG